MVWLLKQQTYKNILEIHNNQSMNRNQMKIYKIFIKSKIFKDFIIVYF